MKIFLLPFLLGFVTSCTNDSKDIYSGTLSQKSNISCLDTRLWHQECLAVDSVKINGVLPPETTLSELIRILGKPKKILPQPSENSNLYYIAKNNQVNYYYYDSMTFEECEGKVLLHAVGFRGNETNLTSSRITLNAKTLPKEVQAVFPESGKLISGTGNVWSGYMMINAAQPYAHGRIWFLIFNQERLSKIILYDVPVYD